MKKSTFKLTTTTKKLLNDTLERCGEEIDLAGWRYNQMLGIGDYMSIETGNENIQYQFGVCLKFLKQFFPRKFNTETISSRDLKSAAQLWWETEKEVPISINNGIMLLAIIARGLAPPDLWYSMEIYQQALIPITNWNLFCKQYEYETKVDWVKLNKEDNDLDMIKIN